MGRVTITTASHGGVAITGNVSGGMVGTFVLPPEILKFLQQPGYRPAPLPPPGELADRGTLPLGSRLPFSANAIFTDRQEYLRDLAGELLYAWENTDGPDFSGAVIAGMGEHRQEPAGHRVLLSIRPVLSGSELAPG